MATRVFEKHKVYNVSYHIIWIPKYRKHILIGRIRDSLINHLIKKADELNIKIEAYEIMSDHVHLFIKSNTYMPINKIVQQLKGYTSFMLRKEFPVLKKYKSLWTHSYYCETIGLISEKTIKKYIALQKSKGI